MEQNISLICRQIIKACELIEDMSATVGLLKADGPEDLLDVYTSLRLDELEHVQLLAIQLTSQLSSDVDTNQDESEGSAFGPGELNCVKSDDCQKEKNEQ